MKEIIVKRIEINSIPTLIWGEKSDKVYLCVHGKMSSKEAMEGLALLAERKGCQVVSFDLPQHGERKNEERRCDIWNGVEDLRTVGDYVFANWKEVSLYACSLGAYFSLHAYHNREIKKCLLQSPILDMEYLIRQMMEWFQVSEERLMQEKEVDTPIDKLSWEYYQYVLDHPVKQWNIPTCILYGGKDTLQSLEVIRNFVRQYACELLISEDSEHSFMGEEDGCKVEKWLRDNL